MQVFRELAGYSFGRADIVRRAMAKKKHDVMERERDSFIYGEKDKDGNILCEGAVNRGVPEDVAKKIFNDMSAFSSYAFNKSHAAAYAVVAYRTAYLKAHYSDKYMAALMTSVLDSADKISQYTAECKRMGIKMLPPSVNESLSFFHSTKDGIRFGILAVKNIGRGLIDKLIAERENGGNYTSLYDFSKRNYSRDLNRRALEGLIKSGALDQLEKNRRQMLLNIDNVLSVVEDEKRFSGDGQLDLFGNSEEKPEYKLPDIEEMPESELLSMEKEATGLYLSGHPVSKYEGYINRAGLATVLDVVRHKYTDGKRISIVCVINSVKVRQLKNKSIMAAVEIEDVTASIGVTVFSNAYSLYRTQLLAGNIFVLTGKVSEREDRQTEIILERLETVPENAEKITASKVKNGLYLRLKNMEIPEMQSVKALLSNYRGNIPVYIVCTDNGKRFTVPDSLKANGDQQLIAELSKLLGDANVKLVL